MCPLARRFFLPTPFWLLRASCNIFPFWSIPSPRMNKLTPRSERLRPWNVCYPFLHEIYYKASSHSTGFRESTKKKKTKKNQPWKINIAQFFIEKTPYCIFFLIFEEWFLIQYMNSQCFWDFFFYLFQNLVSYNVFNFLKLIIIPIWDQGTW